MVRTMTSRAITILSSDDRLGVFDLLARYAWTLDTADPDAFARLFTPDGALVTNRVRHEGREAIQEYVRTLTSRETWAGTQHYTDQVEFEEASNGRCRLRAYCTVVVRSRDGSVQFRSLNAYYDLCQKTGDRWYFVERVGELWGGEKPS